MVRRPPPEQETRGPIPLPGVQPHQTLKDLVTPSVVGSVFRIGWPCIRETHLHYTIISGREFLCVLHRTCGF